MALTDNLIAYYKLDESSGDAIDASGAGLTLTNTNSVTYGTGKINNGANISGSQMLVSSSSSFTNVSTFTWAGWVKWTTITANYRIIDKGSWWFGVGGGGNGLNISVSAPTTAQSVSSNTFSTGTWYFVVATYDDAGDRKARLYVDGTETGYNSQSAASGTFNSNAAYSFRLGNSSGGAEPLQGVLDEVGVWSRVLTGTEITDLYNSGTGLQYPFSGGGIPGFATTNLVVSAY